MAEDPARASRRGLIPAEVLAQVPGCEDGRPPAAVEPLQKTPLSRSWRVRTDEGEFVARLRLAFAPGVDHAREARLHAVAAAAGLAPALIHADEAGRFIITEYLAGTAWRPEDFGKPDRIRRLGAWFRELHALDPPAVAPFDVLDTARSYSERILRIRPAEAPLHESLLNRAALAAARCASDRRAPAIVHNDPFCANLIETGRLQAIDWEYAAVCDPLVDLACVLAYYPGAALHAGELLSESGLSGRATLGELEEATWLAVLISYLWHRLVRLSFRGAGDEAAERLLLRRLRD